MEPGAGRVPIQVLGENEALQQFFCDLSYEPSYWCTQPEVYAPETPSASCPFKDQGSAPSHSDLLTHDQLRGLGLTNTYITPRTPPTPLHQHTHHSPEHYLNPESCSQGYTPPTPPSPPLPPTNSYVARVASQGMVPNVPPPPSDCLLGPASNLQTGSPHSKKRRRSESEEQFAAVDGSCCEGDATHGGNVGGVSGLGLMPSQLLTWEQYSLGQWSTLYDRSYKTLSSLSYHVDTDKGFNYSPTDEAFVCQKKNHFQVTVHIGVTAEPHYVRTPSELQEVDHFQIKVFGVKLETPSHLVTIEQSQPDRSKKPFHPIRVSLSGGKVTKVTLGRLHFSETTANNMRKKGKPNPDQRYFQMVVGLYAAVGEETFLLTALVSEKIIVRASNPGQFETDGDASWQRGAVQEAIVYHGRVGINTNCPDEALVVCGNAKVMGSIMQPSDCRAKQNIQEVDSEQQLKRITQMRIVEFDYKPEFASTVGINHTHQTGVIAQEVKELLPSAVKEVGDVICLDGERIHNLLMVDKEQIFMENVGAVQQLSKLTDDLDTRIKELEVWNRRLAKLKSLTGSLRSNGRPQRQSSVSTTAIPEPCKTEEVEKQGWCRKYNQCMQKKVILASFFTLLATMAFCIICVTTLHLLNVNEKDFDLFPGHSNNSVAPVPTIPQTSTVSVTSRPHGPWPPDVDFCDLLYCDQVYCCPSPAEGSTDYNIMASVSPAEFEMTAKRKERLGRYLKSARDWKNTTVHTFMIKENQQVIDSRYCMRDECGPERYIFRVPISQFVPVNMRVTLLMNSTELLVVHLCGLDESTSCTSLLDVNEVSGSRYPSNTQGEHEWPLHVARLFHSSYHFRSAVAGQADCSTDRHYAGALFTDYHFYFYRRCTDKHLQITPGK
ncbi:myelin regulatory factor-like protein [Odontesthes bonariensis]